MPTNKNKYSSKPLKDIDSVKYMANLLRLSQKLKKEHDLFLSDLYLICFIYRENIYSLRPTTRPEILNAYPILSFRLDKAVERLIMKGIIVNGSKRPAKTSYRLSLSTAGEQLLIKYDRSLRKMANTTKRYTPNEE